MAKVKKASKSLPTMTRAEIAALIARQHAVYIYPRKELVIVDGYKHYRLIHASERGER